MMTLLEKSYSSISVQREHYLFYEGDYRFKTLSGKYFLPIFDNFIYAILSKCTQLDLPESKEMILNFNFKNT